MTAHTGGFIRTIGSFGDLSCASMNSGLSGSSACGAKACALSRARGRSEA